MGAAKEKQGNSGQKQYPAQENQQFSEIGHQEILTCRRLLEGANVHKLCTVKYLTTATWCPRMVRMAEHRIRRQRRFPVAAGRAVDDLRYIRQTMEQSASFTALPGWGQVVMGGTALLAAWVASRQSATALWLAVWLADAVLAASVALVATQNKAQRTGVPLTSGPARKFALSFLPPIGAAAILTPVLYQAGLVRVLPGTWLLLYGAGVVSAGAFSVAIIPQMGVGFIITGIGALLLPGWGNIFMAAGFGGLHLIFGFLIARRCGG